MTVYVLAVGDKYTPDNDEIYSVCLSEEALARNISALKKTKTDWCSGDVIKISEFEADTLNFTRDDFGFIGPSHGFKTVEIEKDLIREQESISSFLKKINKTSQN